MNIRNRLPDRRLSVTVQFTHNGPVTSQRFHLTVGFDQGRAPMEIFLNSSQKSGSEADINASDAAIAVSIALQYGAPLDELCKAMRRNTDGTPTGPIGAALDLVEQITKEHKYG